MRFRVVWSPEAELTYSKILVYLIDQWGVEASKNFMNRTDEVLYHLERNPRIYIYSEKAKAYRAVITRQASFLFQIRENTVEIITTWDNRQQP